MASSFPTESLMMLSRRNLAQFISTGQILFDISSTANHLRVSVNGYIKKKKKKKKERKTKNRN